MTNSLNSKQNSGMRLFCDFIYKKHCHFGRANFRMKLKNATILLLLVQFWFWRFCGKKFNFSSKSANV